MPIVAVKAAMDGRTLRLVMLAVGEDQWIPDAALAMPGISALVGASNILTGDAVTGFEDDILALRGGGADLTEVAVEYELSPSERSTISLPDMLPRLPSQPATAERPTLFLGDGDRPLGAVPAREGVGFVALNFLAPAAAVLRATGISVMYDSSRARDHWRAERLLAAAGPIRRFLEHMLGRPNVAIGLRLVDDEGEQWTSAAPAYRRDFIRPTSIDDFTLVRYCASLYVGCGVGLLGAESTDVITGFGAAIAVAYLEHVGHSRRAAHAQSVFGSNPKAPQDFLLVFEAVLAMSRSAEGQQKLRDFISERWGESVGAVEFAGTVSRASGRA